MSLFILIVASQLSIMVSVQELHQVQVIGRSVSDVDRDPTGDGLHVGTGILLILRLWVSWTAKTGANLPTEDQHDTTCFPFHCAGDDVHLLASKAPPLPMFIILMCRLPWPCGFLAAYATEPGLPMT